MPSAAKATTPLVQGTDEFEVRSAELADYTVSFETYYADANHTHLFRGLPDDRCQCPHWGVVLKGKLVIHFPDHDETYVAGEAYYLPPGHTPSIFKGGEVVVFSPTKELRESMDVVDENMKLDTDR